MENSEIFIEDMNFSIRVYNSLKGDKINTLGDLIRLKSENYDFSRLRNLGIKSIEEINFKINISINEKFKKIDNNKIDCKININLLRKHVIDFMKKNSMSISSICKCFNVDTQLRYNIATYSNKKYTGDYLRVIDLFKISSKLGTNIYDYIQN